MPVLASPIAAWLLSYRYIIIFPLAIVEGPILMFICGFLLHMGYFSFFPLYFTLVAGDFTADLLWYGVGFYGAKPFVLKYGKYVNLSLETVLKIERLFEKHHDKILFISKITMGFGFALATLVAAGMAKVPFKKYVFYNLFGGFIWTGLLLAGGYFLGNLYAFVDSSLRWAFIGATIFIAALALYGFSKFMRKRFGNDANQTP